MKRDAGAGGHPKRIAAASATGLRFAVAVALVASTAIAGPAVSGTALAAPGVSESGVAQSGVAGPVVAEATVDAAPANADAITADPRVEPVEFDPGAFRGDPVYEEGHDPEAAIEIYGGKRAVPVVRPMLEVGRDLYGPGPIGEGIAIFGEKNRATPQLVVFGDARTAVAWNRDAAGKEVSQVAARLNLFTNLQLTGTERFLMLWEPFQDGTGFSRYEFGGADKDPGADPQLEFNSQPTTLFFEGDLGAIVTGLADSYQGFDLPIAFGRVPLLFQNGIWMEDAILGGAFTIPARHHAGLGITNYDLTFFGGFQEVTSDAFLDAAGRRDDNEAALVGLAGFFDLAEGYLETGVAYLHDRDTSDGDDSYANLTVGFSRRYGGLVSNALRLVANVGQDPGAGRAKTADGALFLVENAFLTRLPLTLVPYANFWMGVDSPQSVARAGAAGGILRNVGLSFETDNLTGFPTLDTSGGDTLGGALGLQYLFALDQQVVVEAAAVVPWDGRNGAVTDRQYAASVRYQIPLTNQVILRTDAIYGFQEGPAEDLSGMRLELRYKF